MTHVRAPALDVRLNDRLIVLKKETNEHDHWALVRWVENNQWIPTWLLFCWV